MECTCSLSWAFVGDRTLLLGGYSLGYSLCRWWFVDLLCMCVCVVYVCAPIPTLSLERQTTCPTRMRALVCFIDRVFRWWFVELVVVFVGVSLY